jgi:hypothetical protein
MMEAIGSSETSVLTGVTLYHIPEDGNLSIHDCETLKFYIAFTPISIHSIPSIIKSILGIYWRK